MAVFDAVLIDDVLYKNIARNGIKGRINSIFKDTANFITSKRDLVIITTRKKCGPNMINIAVPENSAPLSSVLKENLRFKSSRKEILFKDDAKSKIQFAKTKRWKAEFKPKTKSNKIESNLAVLKSIIQETRIVETSVPFYEKLLERLSDLANSVQKLDREANTKIKMLQLTGLGLGLTPSGDDMMMGILSLFYYVQKIENPENRKRIKYFMKQLANTLKLMVRKTTITSLKSFEFGLEGRFSQVLQDFIIAVVSGSRGEISKAYDELQVFSETSGYDIGLGVLRGCEILLNNRK